MYTVSRTNEFKKSLKRCLKRGLDIGRLEEVIRLLAETGSLSQKYKPHKLTSKFDYNEAVYMALFSWRRNSSRVMPSGMLRRRRRRQRA